MAPKKPSRVNPPSVPAIQRSLAGEAMFQLCHARDMQAQAQKMWQRATEAVGYLILDLMKRDKLTGGNHSEVDDLDDRLNATYPGLNLTRNNTIEALIWLEKKGWVKSRSHLEFDSWRLTEAGLHFVLPKSLR